MNAGNVSYFRVPLLLLPLLTAGCSLLNLAPPQAGDLQAEAPTAPDPAAPRLAPLPTMHYDGLSTGQQIVGDVQVIFSRYENTFVQIARRYDIGYESLRNANPGVDQWLPGEQTPIYLPTMSILPDAPREGVVINLPAMRLFYFTAGDDSSDTEDAAGGALDITSHPIGIGREGWATPTGSATVTQRARDPAWYPPASVREEHAALGDPLPSVVPPGPDNPLGRFALRLSMPGYLIHGTNKPAGVGMRVSHGCIRLYPEDIEALYERIGIGTDVNIVDQPILAGWRDGELYLEVHPQLAEDERDPLALARTAIEAALAERDVPPEGVDWERVGTIVAAARGMPFPVLATARAPEHYLASVRIIENLVPVSTEQSTASR